MIELIAESIRSLLWLALSLSIALSVSFTVGQFARMVGRPGARPKRGLGASGENCHQ